MKPLTILASDIRVNDRIELDIGYDGREHQAVCLVLSTTVARTLFGDPCIRVTVKLPSGEQMNVADFHPDDKVEVVADRPEVPTTPSTSVNSTEKTLSEALAAVHTTSLPHELADHPFTLLCLRRDFEAWITRECSPALCKLALESPPESPLEYVNPEVQRAWIVWCNAQPRLNLEKATEYLRPYSSARGVSVERYSKSLVARNYLQKVYAQNPSLILRDNLVSGYNLPVIRLLPSTPS